MGAFVSGGRSNEEVTAENIANEKLARGLEQKIEYGWAELRQRSPEIAAAARAEVDAVMARAFADRPRLECLKQAAEIVSRYESDGAALLAERRQRRVDEQQREIATRAAVEEQRAVVYVREHPLTAAAIVKMAEISGILRLGDGVIEASGTLDLVTNIYIKTAAKEVAQLLDARTRFEAIAKVPRDEESK
jgi:hypothetical protein